VQKIKSIKIYERFLLKSVLSKDIDRSNILLVLCLFCSFIQSDLSLSYQLHDCEMKQDAAIAFKHQLSCSEKRGELLYVDHSMHETERADL